MIAPQEFVKKPVVVEAMQWTGDNARELMRWAEGDFGVFTSDIKPLNPEHTAELFVQANSSWLGLVTGEWVIRDKIGFYPCKPDVFASTYDPR